MRIEVSAVEADRVSFRCTAGVGAGVWRAEDPPVPGRSYDVELDVEGDVQLRRGGAAGLWLEGASVVLGGRWQVTEDGATYLDLGSVLVSVETADSAAAGVLVEVVAAPSAVQLFPFTL